MSLGSSRYACMHHIWHACTLGIWYRHRGCIDTVCVSAYRDLIRISFSFFFSVFILSFISSPPSLFLFSNEGENSYEKTFCACSYLFSRSPLRILLSSDMGATRPASPENPLSARWGYLKRVSFPTSSRLYRKTLSGRVFLFLDNQSAFPYH